MLDYPSDALPPSPAEGDPLLQRIHDPLALPGETLEELELAGSPEGYQEAAQRADDPDAPRSDAVDEDDDEFWSQGQGDLEEAEDD